MPQTNSQNFRKSPATLVAVMNRLAAGGLCPGRSGNVSQRTARGLLITPTGIAPEQLHPDGLVEIDHAGQVLAGTLLPSSEWPMHAAVYAARPDAASIVHCHSRHVVALACCRREIPAFHYMVAVAGGDSIRCAPYALFGSAELAANAIEALHGRRACLLANHGQISIGPDLDSALALAFEVEELAAQYSLCLAIGEPALLSRAEMDAVLQRFGGYGQQRPPAA